MLSVNRTIQTSLFLLSLSLLVALPARSQQTTSDPEEVGAPELRQEMRAELVELMRTSEGQPNMQEFMRMKASLDSLDAANTSRLSEIIEEHGWPGPTLVGREGTEAAFLIVQHADLAFQKEALPLVQKAHQRGELSGQSLALLTDRVRVGEGEPQLYGTQANIQNGEIAFHPIADSAQVDRRRAELGMPPLSEYIEQMKAVYMQQQGDDN